MKFASDCAIRAVIGAAALICASSTDAAAPADAANVLQVPIGQPDVSSDGFVSWARGRAISLHDLAAERSAAAVKRVIGTAPVVALGEPAHGAHEPLALRNHLFRYLVEESGFTAIALESGLSESRRANDFASGGPGEPQQVAGVGYTWGFGEYAENVELLRWIRQYNADPARRRKIRIYGIDLSGAGNDGEFSNARIALEDALSYLARVAPEVSRRARGAVGPFLQQFSRERHRSLPGNEREQLRGTINGLVSIFEREREVLIAASSEEEYEWAYRNAIVARQLDELFRLWPADLPSAGVSPGLHAAVTVRDVAMADNIRWVQRREGPSGRVLVFAHNAHVMNAPLRGGIWNVYPQPPITMGQHLRAALGKDLLIIGTSSATNGPGLPSGAEAGSVDAALADIGLAHFLLDLRDASENAAAVAWLGQRQSMRANFTTQMVLPLGDAFDALVFSDRLTPACGSAEQ